MRYVDFGSFEGWPACQRCMKASLNCSGCRATTFIQYDGQKPRQEISESQGTSAGSADLIPLGKQQVTFSKQAPHSLWALKIQIPHDELFENYTRTRLQRGPDTEDIVITGIDRSLTHESVLALSTTFFGAEHRDSGLIQRGLWRYSRVLGKLNKALGDPSQYQSFDLLSAVVIMSLFEYIVSERERGWVNHARGLERLMELRGPQSFTSLPALMILDRTRPTLIFAALVLRQTTILTKREWKTIPWSLYPRPKTSMQMLLDIFADCPELIAAKDGLEADALESDIQSKRRHLAVKAQGLLEELEQFQQTWSAAYPACSWEVACSAITPCVRTPAGESVPLWSTVLNYQSLYHANVVLMSLGVRILLLSTSRDLSFSGPSPDEEYIRNLLVTSGITICQSVEYYLHETRIGGSGHLLVFPLKMAYEAVSWTNPALEVWLKDILDQFSSGLAGRWSQRVSPMRLAINN